MKFTTILSTVSIVLSVAAQGADPGAEIRAKRTCPTKITPAAQQDPSRAQFAPDLGATPGLQDPVCVQNKFGERTSQVKPVKVPCDCPPAQADFAKQFAIDHGTKIDNSGSVAGRENNLRLAIQTLQGSFCCPAGSVTLNDQLTKAASGGGQPSKNNGGSGATNNSNASATTNDNPNPVITPLVQVPSTSANGADRGAAFRQIRENANGCPAKLPKSANVDQSLARFAPNLGAAPGLDDPECTKPGDRTSPISGKKVPCDCPPSQADFVKQFLIDQSDKIKTDGSRDSNRRNIELAIQTLQGSFCCPAASVTLSQQLKAL